MIVIETNIFDDSIQSRIVNIDIWDNYIDQFYNLMKGHKMKEYKGTMEGTSLSKYYKILDIKHNEFEIKIEYENIKGNKCKFFGYNTQLDKLEW